MHYRIGRIDGPWTNFTPPILGGVFRTRVVLEQEAFHAGWSDSSILSSRVPSPVFGNDHDAQSVQQRPGASAKERVRPPSVSSTSMVEPEEMDDMSYLDTVTIEHISLDLEKYPPVDEETQANIVAKYRELHQKVYDDSLYNCSY